MDAFRVITDGSGDLPPEVIKARGITVINFFVMLGSGSYLQQNVDIGDDEFYEWMVAHPGVYPSSSTPSTQDYLKVFTEIAKAGEKAVPRQCRPQDARRKSAGKKPGQSGVCRRQDRPLCVPTQGMAR